MVFSYRKIIAALSVVLMIIGPAHSLDISFPVESGSGAAVRQRAESGVRTLKGYFDNFQVTYSGDVYRSSVDGDRSRVFRPDDTYWQNLTGITMAKNLENGTDYDIRMTLRHTTDPVITNRDDIHFTSFIATYRRPDVWEMRAGDLYPNLSRYTFNRFAEGWQGRHFTNIGDGLRLRTEGVIGRTQRARENATLLRAALGGGLTLESKRIVNNRPIWDLGVRHGYAADKLGSVDNHGTLADLHLGVTSVVYNASLPSGWRVEGENAWSVGSSNRKTSPADQNGYAWLTNINWSPPRTSEPYEGMERLRPFAFQFNWELVDPYFLTGLGVAAADQKRWSARTAHRWNRYFDWTLSHLRLEDNVRDQKAVTNISRTSTISLNSTPFRLFNPEFTTWIEKVPESVKNIQARTEFRYNRRDASDASVNAKIEDYNYSLTYQNWNATFRGDYHFQITDDDARPNNERRVQEWGMLVTRPFHWKEWDVRFFPRMSYRYSRDLFRITGTATRLQTATFGLGANWEELSGTLNYVITDSNRDPAGSDYLQNRINGSITYRPYLFPSLQTTLSGSWLDYDAENPTENFNQLESKLSVRYAF